MSERGSQPVGLESIGRRIWRVIGIELLFGVALAAFVVQASTGSVAPSSRPRVTKQVPDCFEDRIGSAGAQNGLAYWTCFPHTYAANPQQNWPLLLYLHGSGERGSDLDLVRRNGLPALIDDGLELPMIVVSPQCPRNGFWDPDQLWRLIEHLTSHLRVDTDRIYVTGFSMGAYGAWDFAVAHGDRLAAIVPLAGGCRAQQLNQLRGMPAWAFHGACDTVVPLTDGQAIVDVVRKAGGKVRFTVLPNERHSICADVYSNPEVYRWLLQQTLGGREKGHCVRQEVSALHGL